MNKYIILLLIGVSFLTVNSCKSVKSSRQSFDVSQYVKGDSQELLDLSNKNLREFPDLSGYSIKKLDLSHNRIEKIIAKYLPKGITELNISHNKLKDSLEFLGEEKVEIINVSYNDLRYIYVQDCIKNLDASNNDLNSIFFNCSLLENSMDTLNISNNKNLSNVLRFNPKAFKIVLRNNIENDKELIWALNSSKVNTIKTSKKRKN